MPIGEQAEGVDSRLVRGEGEALAAAVGRGDIDARARARREARREGRVAAAAGVESRAQIDHTTPY
jgi:hypothetical protein